MSKEWSPKIGAQGAIVIDNSSQWRMDPDVPLIVPEVNAHALEGFRKKNIIANPNCSTAQLVVALKPLHDKAKIKRVVVSTYQSVSGAGKDAMDELWAQTKGMYVPGQEVEAKVAGFGARVFKARVNYMASSLDPATRRLAAGDVIGFPSLAGPVRLLNDPFPEPVAGHVQAGHSHLVGF